MCIERIRQQRMVWHFCTPKSASTFLMSHMLQATANNPAIGNIRNVPVHGNRPQVICVYTTHGSIIDRDPAHVMLGRHTHALASDDILEMISNNHLVIVQSRGVLDTVVSLIDHLNKNAVSPWLTGGKESPALVASAIEFIFEGLHLNKRLNKDETGTRATYRARA